MPLLQSVRRHTKPTIVDLYGMFCAVLYLLRTGSQWRFLRSELHKFAVIPRRGVIERSFAWLEKKRRLSQNCERLLNTSLQLSISHSWA